MSELVGKYDRMVSFQAATTTKSSMGAPVKTYAHSFYAWCSRNQVGEGNEQYLNDRLANPYRFVYKTHFRSDINETMQLVDASVKYNILSCMPTGMNMFIEIVVEKIIE